MALTPSPQASDSPAYARGWKRKGAAASSTVPSAGVASMASIQAAAEIDDGRLWMRSQIIPHLPGQIALTHGDFQRAEHLHQAV